MIMILGSSHDDVLYFEAIMTKKRQELIFNRYPVTFGRIFNQDVVLVYDVYTNYMSNAITLHLISKYMILLVFTVGTCVAYSDDVEFGEIAIAKQVFLSDVDQIGNKPVKLGQIPDGFPQFYKTDLGVLDCVHHSISLKTFVNHFDASFISSNTYYTRQEQIDPYLTLGEIAPVKKKVVFDSTYGGVALACYLSNISCISLKVVETHFTTPMDYIDYSKILESFSTLGKIVVSSIGDIGRSDILEGN